MTRDELLENAKADHAFVTKNEHKLDRERWVLDRWLEAQDRHPKEIRQGDDPPDFVVDGTGVEVVEAMEAGRRRGDEYKAKVEAAEVGRVRFRRPLSLRKVREDGHLWILNQVRQKTAKGYDAGASSRWTLLVYVNFSWTDKIQWQLLEAKLSELNPPFACVEVVYSDETGHVTQAVFDPRKEEAKTPRDGYDAPKAAEIGKEVKAQREENLRAVGDIHVDMSNHMVAIGDITFQLHPATPCTAPDPATIKFTAPQPGPVADSWDIYTNGKKVGRFSITVQRKDGLFRVAEALTYDASLPNAAHADVVAHAWVESFDAGDSPLPIRRKG